MEYYTFEINNEKIGYYEQRDKNGIFYANARMVIDGEKVENRFWIKHRDGRVVEIKFGESDWIVFDQPNGVYPSSATNLLLEKMRHQKSFSYQSYNEGEGKITGELTLQANGDRVEEYADDKLVRYFVQKDGVIVEIGWGGTAKSVLVGSLSEATAGTLFEKKRVTMNIHQRESVIFAENFQAVVDWYQEVLNFKITRAADEHYNYCNLENENGIQLGIADAKEMGIVPGERINNTVVLQFQISDVPGFFAYLKENGDTVTFGPSFNEKDGFWYGGFQDLEGNPFWVVDENCP